MLTEHVAFVLIYRGGRQQVDAGGRAYIRFSHVGTQ